MIVAQRQPGKLTAKQPVKRSAFHAFVIAGGRGLKLVVRGALLVLSRLLQRALRGCSSRLRRELFWQNMCATVLCVIEAHETSPQGVLTMA